MPNIYDLIPDIYRVLAEKGEGLLNLTVNLKPFKEDQKPRLRISGLGPKCPRHLWYSINAPELGEPLPPQAIFKFSYGHLIEDLVIQLAKEAGHEVMGEQDELVVDGVRGHRDCVIDGCLVDAKSCSSRIFEKFKTGTISNDDPFGYLVQLDGYLDGSDLDPLVRVKDRGYILAVDKTLGHMCLYEHKRRHNVREIIKKYRDIVNSNKPPQCECVVVSDGVSGNMKLGVTASYSPFKHQCFPKLRTFLYADGPRFLTTVFKLPKVPEVDRNGNIIHNTGS